MSLPSRFILPQIYSYFSRSPIICLLGTNYFLSSELPLWIKLCDYTPHNVRGHILCDTGCEILRCANRNSSGYNIYKGARQTSLGKEGNLNYEAVSKQTKIVFLKYLN